jgi:hypothetical protein
MFENWISPRKVPPHQAFGLTTQMFGQAVRNDLEERENERVLGLVGFDPKWADYVRRHLYRFTAVSTPRAIYDLGDFRKPQPEFVAHALRALMEAGICPIVIGNTAEVNKVILQMSAPEQSPGVSILFHETVPAWAAHAREEGHLHIFGAQQHLLDGEVARLAASSGVELRRLGMLRDNLAGAEPEIRDAEFVAMDLSSLRVSDLPAQNFRSTSGFSTEEACRLMRYAGQATGLRALLVSGHDKRSTEYRVSANTTAQLLWYFVEAHHQSTAEKPVSSEQFQRYVLHLEGYKLDLVFYKSHRTGRWWVEIPAGPGALMFSCAHQDYQSGCEGQVSERLIRCIRHSLQYTEQPF